MDSKDLILSRVKKCDDLMKSGKSKRVSLAESGCHATTYDKYLPDIQKMGAEELKHLDEVWQKNKKPVKPTVKQEIKSETPDEGPKCKILITIDKKYYDILQKEANDQEIYHVSIVARKYLLSSLKQAYGLK